MKIRGIIFTMYLLLASSGRVYHVVTNPNDLHAFMIYRVQLTRREYVDGILKRRQGEARPCARGIDVWGVDRRSRAE